jgi:hypothetical protein
MTIEYAAGLFDGEGFFQIDKAPRKDTKRGYAYQAHARITMRDKDVLEEFQRLFGGSLRRSAKATDKRAEYWSWDVCGEGALGFAKRVGPSLHIKQKQANLVSEFQAYKSQNKNRACDDLRWARYEELYQAMKALNKKGPR